MADVSQYDHNSKPNGIPPQQVIGTAAEASYKVDGGEPTIMKEPGIAFLDDKEGNTKER